MKRAGWRDATPAEWDALRPSAARHVPHLGNHKNFACGFSGPHCWTCGEPWPCQHERRSAVCPCCKTPYTMLAVLRYWAIASGATDVAHE